MSSGKQLRLVDVGVARTSADDPIEQRLLSIWENINDWLQRYTPEAVAVERVFVGTNIPTVAATAQVSGLVLVAAAKHDIPVTLHTPTEMKATVTGYGNAPKTQIQEMVRRILNLNQPPSPADAADALALAITNAWRASAATDPAAKTALPAQAHMTSAQQRWAQARQRAEANKRRAVARLRQR